MTNKDLLLFTIETREEEYFDRKCRLLLDMYGKRKLIEMTKDPNLFQSLFINDVLSTTSINYILMKKYYLSDNQKKVTQDLDRYISTAYFDIANDIIENNNNTRALVFQTYIDNIDNSNHQLSIRKTDRTNYDDINLILTLMYRFYKSKSLSVVPTLKKAYNLN